MRIPHTFNPLGKTPGAKHFELVVKPGILASTMTYGFTPYWNSGGYCSVDWGDGQKEDATISGTKLNHTYAVAGTYAIRIDADCYQVGFAGWDSYPIVVSCSGDWNKLGNLTSGYLMFYHCTNMQINCTSLPEGMTRGDTMFNSCTNAQLPLTKLPDELKGYVGYMFYGCTKATLPLTSLPDGVKYGEYMFFKCLNAELPLTKLSDSLTDGYHMFYGCTKATLPLTSLPNGLTNGGCMFCLCKTAKFSFVSLPESLTNGSSMFDSCVKAELPLTKLPDALTNGDNMFSGCGNAQLPLTSLPDGLTTASGMFYVCRKAEIKLTKLPSELTNCFRMFQYCTNAEINLDTLVANASEEGWTKLTDITNMFNNCPKVTGSRSAFLAKCPANVVGADTAFLGTNTTESGDFYI